MWLSYISAEMQSVYSTALTNWAIYDWLTDEFISSNSVLHKYAFSFYLTHRLEPISCYLSRLEWTWERWQWRGTLHSPKVQHYWNLPIRLFSVICRTLVLGVLHSTEKQSVYSTAPADRAKNIIALSDRNVEYTDFVSAER